MKTLNAYIPIDRQHALAAGHPLPQSAEGAVLFADFRGFTPMTELLNREFGPNRGADEMAAWLETAFSAIVQPVHAHMGSVISLSGDAMVCWFDNSPPAASNRPPSGAKRATASAIGIRQAMQELQPFRTASGTAVNLGIKVTVTGGAARRFLVGDPEVQRFEILTGSVIRRSADVDHALREAEIAIGSEVIGHFGDEILLGEWRTGEGGEHFRIVQGLKQAVPPTPWPDPPLLPESVTRAFLPQPVFSRIQVGRSEFLADLRPVTPMFISFSGIDFDLDYEAGDKLDTLIRRVQSVLIKYEGYLLQITIGDKGSYLYASFGAPTAHEDDPSRAAHAAFDLASLPASLPYLKDLRIGISQGLTYAGAYGGISRQVYGALGNEVNIAARLMSMAQPGEILATERVVKAVSSEFDVEERGSHELKGISLRIPVYLLKRHRHRHGRESALGSIVVGREKEISLLRRALSDNLQGIHRTVVMEGEPGIGKSILLEQWAAEVYAMKIPVFEGNGSAIENTTAYFAWRQIFQAIFEIEERDAFALSQEKVLQKIAPLGFESMAPLLNRVLSLNFPETDQTIQMDSEGRANSTRSLLVAVLKHALKNNPAVIILDDCQYFDSASWKLLSSIESEIPWAMLVLSSRPRESGAEQAPEYHQIKAEPGNIFFAVGRLDESQTADLIRQRLKIRAVPDLLIDMITSTAEGHPFFSEELAYALRDAGILQIKNGDGILKQGVSSLGELNFPLTVQGVITSRIDRLDTHKQLTLKAASVIGRVFPVQTLRDIHPSMMDTDLPLTEHLDILDRMDLVHPEALEPSLRYIFKHSITHGVVYQMMTHIQRKTLHQKAAEWYEARFAENLSSAYTLLAFHWARAEHTQKAIDYYEKAGDEALKNFAHEEAVSFFNEALKIDAAAGFPCGNERRAYWELRAGEANVYWTRYTQGRAHLETGLRLLGLPVPEPGLKAAVATLRAFGIQNLHRTFPQWFLQKKAADSKRLLAASSASQRLIEVYYHSGDMLRSTYLTFNSLNMAELAHESGELVEAYAGAAPFFYFIGLGGITDAYFKRANLVHGNVKNLRSFAYLLLVKCGVDIGKGRWDEGRRDCEDLIQTGEQLGSTRRQNDGLQHLTILETMKAEYKSCISLSERLLVSAKKIRDNRFQAYALFGLAYSNHFLGDHDACTRYLDRMRLLFEGSNPITDEQLELNMYGLLSLCETRHGDSEAGLANGRMAEGQLGGAFQTSFFTLPGYLALGEAYLHLWELNPSDPEASSRAKRVLDALGRFARTFAIGKPGHALLTGMYAHRAGNPVRAQKTWEKGIEIAARMQMPYELARLHMELALNASGLSPAVKSDHLAKAREIFERLGARYETEKIRSTLS